MGNYLYRRPGSSNPVPGPSEASIAPLTTSEMNASMVMIETYMEMKDVDKNPEILPRFPDLRPPSAAEENPDTSHMEDKKRKGPMDPEDADAEDDTDAADAAPIAATVAAANVASVAAAAHVTAADEPVVSPVQMESSALSQYHKKKKKKAKHRK